MTIKQSELDHISTDRDTFPADPLSSDSLWVFESLKFSLIQRLWKLQNHMQHLQQHMMTDSCQSQHHWTHDDFIIRDQRELTWKIMSRYIKLRSKTTQCLLSSEAWSPSVSQRWRAARVIFISHLKSSSAQQLIMLRMNNYAFFQNLLLRDWRLVPRGPDALVHR